VVFRLLLVPVIAFLPFRCGTEYADISRASAVKAARAYVVRVDYRGDVSRFYRNTGDRPTVVREKRDKNGDSWWFVRFDDFQTLNAHCVKVRRSSVRVISRGTAC
jgi:hypothetical protein